MNNFTTKEIPPLTAEEIAEIEAIKNMRYDEIDFSDIPETTDEEWERVRQRRLRKKNLKLAS